MWKLNFSGQVRNKDYEFPPITLQPLSQSTFIAKYAYTIKYKLYFRFLLLKRKH